MTTATHTPCCTPHPRLHAQGRGCSRACGAGGFTLIEVLVAIAVFSIMSALAYSGLQGILNNQQQTDTISVRLTQLQKAIGIISRDLHHLTPRTIRDEFGDRESALLGNLGGDSALQFTRSGWHNPLNLQRSTLQRVSYQLQDEQLVRSSWRVLDRVQGSEADRVILLKDISELEFRFLDQKNQWHNSWPPLSSEGGEVETEKLPVAIELNITLPDWGRISRLYPVAGEALASDESLTTHNQGT